MHRRSLVGGVLSFMGWTAAGATPKGAVPHFSSSGEKAEFYSDCMWLEADGSSLRLRIFGYEFPEIENSEYDSNFLFIAGVVRTGGRRWGFNDPCLLISEVVLLADWLDALSQGHPTSDECSFLEPNLRFQRVSMHKIRVDFALEAAPQHLKADERSEEYGFEIPISPTLALAANQLRAQLKNYPKRAV